MLPVHCVIVGRDSAIKRINETHPSYDPLQYPLIFPDGNDGYHLEIYKKNGKRVSATEFYSFHFITHDRNYLLYYRQLLNVFAVDVAAKIEMEKLLFLKFHQEDLRCDNYIHLKDSLKRLRCSEWENGYSAVYFYW